MPTTSPDSIYFSDTTTTMDPNAISAAQATSLQVALALRQRYEFVWANAAARTAQTGMVNGSTGYQVDTKSEYIYESAAWRLKTPHAEYTATSGSIANASQGLNGSYTIDTGQSTSTVMATPGTSGQIVLTDPGIYLVSVYTQIGIATSGRTFFDISNIAAFTAPIWRYEQVTPGDQAGYALPNYRTATSGTSLYFSTYQTTGGARSVSTRVRITRLG